MTDPSMTAPSSPVSLLDQLDELRAKATPGPWAVTNRRDVESYLPGGPIRCADVDGADTYSVVSSGWCAEEGDQPACGTHDAELIVGAVNAVGPLTAAVRAVLELADSWAALEHWDYKGPEKLARARADSANDAARILRDHVTAALSVTP